MNWPRILLVSLVAGAVMFGVAVAVDVLLGDRMGATALRLLRAAAMAAAMIALLVSTRGFWTKAGRE